MATENDRVLDWDDEVSETDSTSESKDAFVILPDGVYPFKVVKFERKEYKGGKNIPACHEADVGLIFDGGEKGRAYVTKRFYMHTSTLGMIYDFLTAVGLHKRGSGACAIPWSKVEKGVGELCGSAKLKTRSYVYNEEKKTENDVRSWIYPKAESEPEY